MGDKHTQNTGGPAFPQPVLDLGGEAGLVSSDDMGNGGMTLRDYIATHASDQDVSYQGEILRETMVRTHGLGVLPDNWRVTARYMHADAMIAERDKNRPSEVLTALSRLLAQCDRLRMPGMPESDAEKFARQFVTPEAKS